MILVISPVPGGGRAEIARLTAATEPSTVRNTPPADGSPLVLSGALGVGEVILANQIAVEVILQVTFRRMEVDVEVDYTTRPFPIEENGDDMLESRTTSRVRVTRTDTDIQLACPPGLGGMTIVGAAVRGVR